MIVVLKKGHDDADIEKVVKLAESHNLRCHISKGTERTIIGIIGDDRYPLWRSSKPSNVLKMS